ncbi:30S ribosomal protein S20 [Pontibacillus yanchengensis]|uniref:30S ribosomal protein S20 n=2 Tax=Pontibacillus yanchengensis TaxID=462910 RepID=A0ACC7VH57_9BACI|nr:30S ribosomal protein S20 [Pontibacillus yanchengensis]MYL33409.1 30S ribosomal protein S20 [Pontibacillus yanchengensis]MYL53459.1 30S ribosomal protein S20 [Pontibacillus yanchengensis]
MPNIKQAKKRVVTQSFQRSKNHSFKTEMRSAVRKVEGLISEDKKEEAQDALKTAVRKIDKAVSKGLIHRNNGNRHKSRLHKKVKNLSA